MEQTAEAVRDVADAIPPEAFVQSVTQSSNLAEGMDENTANGIAQDVMRDFDTDMSSMEDWMDRMKKGIELAKLVKKDKTYPFPNASNIKYPLITSAALQFNARAYPAIVAPDRMVKVKTYGNDQSGQKAARAERVSEHMSYQLSVEIEEWEEETDKLLVMLPIVGTMVRKVWYDSARGRPRCRLVEPGCFIVNEKVKVLNDAPRCSEILPLYPVEVRERVQSGTFLDIDLEIDDKDPQGLQEFIEQHCRIDMDDDGYPEPYIVTVHRKTRKIVRIVADFEPMDVKYEIEQVQVPVPAIGMDALGQPVQTMQMQMQENKVGIRSIRRGSYFVAYHFLPSLDGKFWGTGLGMLLGDISASINTIINMMIDAGHMASLGGGFIGSELRLKGGNTRFKPGEWKNIGASGGDVRTAVQPMTFPGPDATLFQMLGLLIDAGREIASVQDVITGDSGKGVQTATATIALIEQGLAVFTAAYKRIFRALKQEFKMLAKINAETVTPETYAKFHDMQGHNGGPPMNPQQPPQADPRADYSSEDMDIVPVADPRSVTKQQAMAMSQFLMELAKEGMVDPGEATKRMLEAAGVEDSELLAPKPDPMMQQQQQMGMQAAQADLVQKSADIELTLMKVEQAKADVMKTMSETDAIAANLRLEAVGKTLEAMKLEIERSVASGRGAMAATPRQSGDPRDFAGPTGGSQIPDVNGLLVG